MTCTGFPAPPPPEPLSCRRLEQLQVAVDEHAIVSITNSQGEITYVNEKFCAISGYTETELLGQNHRLVKSGKHDISFYETLWNTISQGKVWRGEVCNLKKGGGIYWVEASIFPVLDAAGIPFEYISIRTDITELKRREDELRVAEERLRRGQAYANIGTWDWDIETGELCWSERIAPLFGHPPGSLATSYENFLAAIHPDDRQSVIDAVDNCLKHDTPYNIEHRVVWPDGTIHWLLERGAVSRNSEGSALKMLGVVQDITDRKQAEIALVTAWETADRASQAKSDFLSSMSHELRTPMNAIIGFAQMLEYDPEISPDQLDNVQEIVRAGHHLLALINEVLDLAKIESGRIDLSMEAIDLQPLTEDCRHLIQPMAEQRHISLTVELAPGTGNSVFADRVRLKQVLINLLSNAVKYNRDGGHITLSTRPGKAGYLHIAVTDTGKGIPPDRIKELFQPFNRLGAETTEIEGSGIGLTITRRLVDMMGGEIGVSSTVGSGSTFWLELRVANTLMSQDRGVNPIEDSQPVRSPSVNTTVLAIDDNPANLKLIAQVMGMREHIHLVSAHTPELGIELAMAHQPGLILLDINMPGMSGYDVLEIFKATPSLNATPVIAITANAMPRDIERGRAAGFSEYITKPIDIQRFLRVIDQHLNPPGANG